MNRKIILSQGGEDTCENSIALSPKFHRMSNVRLKYIKAFEKFKDKEVVEIIDDNKSMEDVSTDIWRVITKKLKL